MMVWSWVGWWVVLKVCCLVVWLEGNWAERKDSSTVEMLENLWVDLMVLGLAVLRVLSWVVWKVEQKVCCWAVYLVANLVVRLEIEWSAFLVRRVYNKGRKEHEPHSDSN